MGVQAAPREVLLLGTANSDGSFTGVTAGTSMPISTRDFDENTFFFESLGTTSGGTILIEEASRPTYTGLWSQVQSIPASGFSGTEQQAVHLSASAYGELRVRVSSAITGGGTILVWLRQRSA